MWFIRFSGGCCSFCIVWLVVFGLFVVFVFLVSWMYIAVAFVSLLCCWYWICCLELIAGGFVFSMWWFLFDIALVAV